MSTVGSEPPYKDGEDEPFFGGNTAVYISSDDSPYATAGYDDGGNGDVDELDSEFAPQPRRRVGKLTVLLAALLVAGAGFLGGVQVQKHQTTKPTAASLFGAAAARRGTGGGFGGGTGGGFGGGAGGTGTGGTGTGGTGTGGTGTGTGTTGTGTGTGTGSTPAVIGQIVSINGDTVVVKNLGGKMITVKLSTTTTVTQAATAADLKAGQTVIVSGTTATDGTVTATTVGTR